jgi:hypothetical protein
MIAGSYKVSYTKTHWLLAGVVELSITDTDIQSDRLIAGYVRGPLTAIGGFGYWGEESENQVIPTKPGKHMYSGWT